MNIHCSDDIMWEQAKWADEGLLDGTSTYIYTYVCIQELLMWIKGVGLVGLLDDGGTCTTLKRNKSAYHL